MSDDLLGGWVGDRLGTSLFLCQILLCQVLF